MKTIEIATAHNIVFRYELASTIQRVLAFSVDAFLLIVLNMLLGRLFISFGSFTIILLTIITAFYHLIFEVFNQGQSPGKMLVKLRVVTLNGATPSPYDYLLRWVFRMVEILGTAGSLAVISIMSSERNQRIGDILAQTTVISLQNDLTVNLESIESVKSVEEINYPGIIVFNDDDMLFLKMSLSRYIGNPNESNKRVLTELADKIAYKLELPVTNYSIEFLKQILTEYIVLTR